MCKLSCHNNSYHIFKVFHLLLVYSVHETLLLKFIFAFLKHIIFKYKETEPFDNFRFPKDLLIMAISFSRNFPSALEYDLHMTSHAYVKYLKQKDLKVIYHKSLAFKKSKKLRQSALKRLLPTPPPPSLKSEKKTVEPEIIPEVRSQKSVKLQEKAKINNQTSSPHSMINGQHSIESQNKQKLVKPGHISKEPSWKNCKLKLKIPLVKIDQKPSKSASKKRKASPGSDTQKVAKRAKKPKIIFSPSKHPSVVQNRPKIIFSPSKVAKKHEKKPKLVFSPSKTGKSGTKKTSAANPNKASSSVTFISTNKRLTLEDKLTCPTCDKIFMAKSILERHLKKSKHGIFEQDKDVRSPPPLISKAMDKAQAEGRQLPHLNEIVQPKIEVGGLTVNKYECHLCNQVFLRVKDLAKHRERMMCSAFRNLLG